MITRVFATPQDVGAAIGQEICTLIQTKPDAVLCLAAGHTSLETFDYLVERQQSGLDFTKARIVELDEWLGMDITNPESCTGFLQKHLFSRLSLGPEQLFLFDAKAADPEAECARMASLMEELGGIDYMFLGLGKNGHLGLNEPGCAPSAGPHVTELSDTTKTVGQKYFSQQTTLEKGITLGIKDILAARRTVLAATGSHKGEIVLRLLTEEINGHLPATFLRRHPDAALYLDREAAGPALEQGAVQL